ncbi:hypothetical protein HDU82_008458 [Entophlyctis luteolus]|nr:hypothetical protein HDU82_008458 [Entophlyctis luteolus]
MSSEFKSVSAVTSACVLIASIGLSYALIYNPSWCFSDYCVHLMGKYGIDGTMETLSLFYFLLIATITAAIASQSSQRAYEMFSRKIAGSINLAEALCWGVKTAGGKYDMQELVKCIAAELKSSNLSVWMDVERGVDSVPLMNGVIHDKSHADWDSQMAVLKAEIIAKLNSAPHGVALSPGSQTALVESVVATAAPSIILPAAVPTTPLTSVTPASRDPAVSDVTVPASISNVDAADTTASSTPIVAGPSSGDFYMKRELEDWLNPVSFESDMASYASQYVEGTRDWAVDAIGKQFTGDANVVWLNGAAGVGKSLVAYLAARSPPSGFTLLSAFFCKHYDEKKNNAAGL